MELNLIFETVVEKYFLTLFTLKNENYSLLIPRMYNEGLNQ